MNLQSELRESTQPTSSYANGTFKIQVAQDHVADSEIPNDYQNYS